MDLLWFDDIVLHSKQSFFLRYMMSLQNVLTFSAPCTKPTISDTVTMEPLFQSDTATLASGTEYTVSSFSRNTPAHWLVISVQIDRKAKLSWTVLFRKFLGSCFWLFKFFSSPWALIFEIWGSFLALGLLAKALRLWMSKFFILVLVSYFRITEVSWSRHYFYLHFHLMSPGAGNRVYLGWVCGKS